MPNFLPLSKRLAATQTKRRSLFLEMLEPRLPLAGDVTASVIDGNLVLTGDANDNQVEVRYLGDNRWQVGTIPSLGTTINGSNDPLILENVTGDLQIDLGDGKDGLYVEGMHHDTSTHGRFGKIQIDLGAGDDQLQLYGVDSDTISIDAGSGNDYLQTLIHSAQNISVQLGDGRNGAHILAFGTESLEVFGGKDSDFITAAFTGGNRVSIDSGDGDDSVTVFDEFQTVDVHLGNGNDRFFSRRLTTNTLTVDGGDGDDSFEIYDLVTTGDVTLLGGAGNEKLNVTSEHSNVPTSFFPGVYARPMMIGGDLVIDLGEGGNGIVLGAPVDGAEAAFCQVNGKIQIIGGSGREAVQLTNLTAGSVDIDFGDGGSSLEMNGAIIQGSVNVQAGAGNDEWRLSDFEVGGDVIANSGDGTDTIIIDVNEPVPPPDTGNSPEENTGNQPDVNNESPPSTSPENPTNETPAGLPELNSGTLPGLAPETERKSENENSSLSQNAPDGRVFLLTSNSGTVRSFNSANRVIINSGDGDDHVEIQSLNVIDELLLALGSNNDTARVGNSSAVMATFNGGDGTEDLFEDAGENSFTQQDVSGFERGIE